MYKRQIYTDGAARGNPGRGGYGAVLMFGKHSKEMSAGYRLTTNNRMEITAAIKSLEAIKTDFETEIHLHTDSAYLINGITKWVYSWEYRNWTTQNKEPVLNKDLWEKLMEIVKTKKVTWHKVEGHVGVSGNERADVIATAYADSSTPDLYSGALSNYQLKSILDMSHNAAAKEGKKSDKDRSKLKAYSYLSLVGGKIEVHKTWAECEARVKGVKAKFRKVLSADEEKALIAEWSAQ